MRGSRSKAGDANATVNALLRVLRAADANGRISAYERIEREHGTGFASFVRSEFEKSLQQSRKRT